MNHRHFQNRALSIWLVIMAGLASGCYTTRGTSLARLDSLTEETNCRLVTIDGEPIRVKIYPDREIDPQFLECHPNLYPATSWRIHTSGWPAVYRSGKYWRHATTGELLRISRADIASIEIEELDLPLTIVSSPLSVPCWIVDFIIDNLEVGFDAVNDRFDSFSRPPVQGKPGRLIEQAEEMPPPSRPVEREGHTESNRSEDADDPFMPVKKKSN